METDITRWGNLKNCIEKVESGGMDVYIWDQCYEREIPGMVQDFGFHQSNGLL